MIDYAIAGWVIRILFPYLFPHHVSWILMYIFMLEIFMWEKKEIFMWQIVHYEAVLPDNFIFSFTSLNHFTLNDFFCILLLNYVIYIFASSIQLDYSYIKHIINIFNHWSDVKESKREATGLGFNCDFNTY